MLTYICSNDTVILLYKLGFRTYGGIKVELLSQKEDVINKVNQLILKTDGPFSVVIADIDNLASINKTYGEEIGNQVIKKVTSILSKNMYKNDYFCNEGDEFYMLLSKKGSERSFMELEEVRRYLSDNTFKLVDEDKSEEIYITLSFGVASYPRDAKNVVDLMRVADSAMFRAKKMGKNRICLSEAENMVLKSSYYTKTQLDRLSELSKANDKTEAFLLREALDDLFKKYSK